MKKFWEMHQKDNSEEVSIFIYGPITSEKWDENDTTAVSFQKDLQALGDVEKINLYINSPGGSVFEGIAIGNMLQRHHAKVTAHVDALAASIASVIVASCDEVIMPENSMLMIHNPWSFVIGNAKEFRKEADDLDRIGQASVITYLAKSGDKLDEEQIKKIMDEETWLSAEEAFNLGLCDKVTKANQIAACINEELFEKYSKVPEKLMHKETSYQLEDIDKLRTKIKNENAFIGAYVEGIINENTI
ncbi:Clp protease ClpP [Listeria monocytogenes]|nr:Clp protease ClpP [Listeria monocytogenes]